MKYRILKQPIDGGMPKSQWDDTKEIYDDLKGSIDDYLIELQAKTGISHAAEAIIK